MLNKHSQKGKKLTEERTYEEKKQDPVVMLIEEKQKTPIIFGQIILAIGDVIVEVQKGKVSLRHGNEDDVLNALNTTENFSDFLSSYLDNVVIHNRVKYVGPL